MILMASSRRVAIVVIYRFAIWLSAVIPLLLGSGYAYAAAAPPWHQFWKAYQQYFIDPASGRVIDWHEGGITTSEGQSYALFFALVDNDRPLFNKLLAWTQDNLAQDDLGKNLPAWRWGQRNDGPWGLLSTNHAADSDLWIAYDLIQAGRLWHDPYYRQIGLALARHIAQKEVLDMPVAGPMLIPGGKYFRPSPETLIINASYLPLPLLASLAQAMPDGPWGKMAETLPAVIAGSAPHGFSPDWVAFNPQKGYFPAPQGVIASYNAIRVYLWAGMTNPQTPGAGKILRELWGMSTYLHSHPAPPLKVDWQTGKAEGEGPSGFSACLIPYLASLHEDDLLQVQLARLQSKYRPGTGLYGHPPAHYYNQNLALFALGWYENVFRFGIDGNVIVRWQKHHGDSSTVSHSSSSAEHGQYDG